MRNEVQTMNEKLIAYYYIAKMIADGNTPKECVEIADLIISIACGRAKIPMVIFEDIDDTFDKLKKYLEDK